MLEILQVYNMFFNTMTLVFWSLYFGPEGRDMDPTSITTSKMFVYNMHGLELDLVHSTVCFGRHLLYS